MKKVCLGAFILLTCSFFAAWFIYEASKNKCTVEIVLNDIAISSFKITLDEGSSSEFGNQVRSVLNDIDSGVFELRIDFSYIPEDYLIRINRVHSIQYDNGNAVFILLGMDPIPDAVQEERKFDSYDEFCKFCQEYLIDCFREFNQNVQPEKW